MANDHRSPFQYELREDSPGAAHLTLYADDFALNCPFQPVVPIQAPDGRMVGGRTPCNTSCPLAEFTPLPKEALTEDVAKEGDWASFRIHCGGQPLSRSVKVVPKSPIETPKPAPLIKM